MQVFSHFFYAKIKKMRSRFSRTAAAVVIKITQIAYDRIRRIFDRKNGGRTHGAFRPPAGVPKPSKYGVGLRKRRAAILTDGLPSVL